MINEILNKTKVNLEMNNSKVKTVILDNYNLQHLIE